MLCPACLTYDVEREANTTVEGTQYCPQHGVEALRTIARTEPLRGNRSASRRDFTPPVSDG